MANLRKQQSSLDIGCHPVNASSIIMSQANHCEDRYFDTNVHVQQHGKVPIQQYVQLVMIITRVTCNQQYSNNY
jgi:hypothetical protein